MADKKRYEMFKLPFKNGYRIWDHLEETCYWDIWRLKRDAKKKCRELNKTHDKGQANGN